MEERTSTLSLFVRSQDLDEGLTLFFDVLMNPEFREDPLKLSKARLIEQLRQANDQPSSVLSREYERLLYGDASLTWQPTKVSFEGVASANLKAAHQSYFFPRNIILAASGDFNKAALTKKINAIIGPWKNTKMTFPVLPQKFPNVEPGVYFVQKKINQGYISLGNLGIENTNPDYFAVQVMNFILGGGSVTSPHHVQGPVRRRPGLQYGKPFYLPLGVSGHFSRVCADQVFHCDLCYIIDIK